MRTSIAFDELASRVGTPGLILLDVRTDGEYSGEEGYPCDPRQGHIPGARHVPLEALLGAAPAGVRELVGAPPGVEVVAYCHSGSRSGVAAAVLSGAGYDARNYDGSWHEWSHRSDAPVELGGTAGGAS